MIFSINLYLVIFNFFKSYLLV